MGNTTNDNCSNNKKESRVVKKLLDLLVSAVDKSEKDKERRIIKLTKAKRIATFDKTFKRFVFWFVVSAFILFVLKFLNDSNINSDLVSRVVIDVIELIIEIINIAFSALLGALIGYILTDGVDPLDDWFDKDIIDEFIIGKLNRKLAADVDEEKPEKDYINCLSYEEGENLVIKYVYEGKDSEKEFFEKLTEDKENGYKFVETRKKLYYLVDLNRILQGSKIKEKLKDNLAFVICFTEIEYEKSVKDGIPYIYINAILLNLDESNNEESKNTNNNNRNTTESDSSNNDKICDWPACKEKINDNEIDYCNKYGTTFFGKCYCLKHQKLIRGVWEFRDNIKHNAFIVDLHHEKTENIADKHIRGIAEDIDRLLTTGKGIGDNIHNELKNKYFKCMGIKKFIIRKPLSATSNDLDKIQETLYANLCSFVETIKGKFEN